MFGLWDLIPYDFVHGAWRCLCDALVTPQQNPTGLCDKCLKELQEVQRSKVF